MESEASKVQDARAASRRAFMAWMAAAGSAAVGALLLVPGASYVLDPVLRARDKKGGFIRVAALSSLSKDHPIAVPVIGEHVDAWTRSPATRLGTVWLRVLSDDTVAALNAECPHLGCNTTFVAEKSCFGCPCHDSTFALDGTAQGGPAPRALDALEARVLDGHVEVRFQRFRTQLKERVELG